MSNGWIISRGKKGALHLRRRVPRRFREVEKRTIVSVALKTDSKSVAETKAAAVWDALLAAWEARLAGQSGAAQERFDAARTLAATKGVLYLPVEAVANLQQLPLLYIGADIEGAIPWGLLWAQVLLPAILFAGALRLGRGRGIVAKSGILLVALAVSAQASLAAEQLARQIAVAALGG